MGDCVASRYLLGRLAYTKHWESISTSSRSFRSSQADVVSIPCDCEHQQDHQQLPCLQFDLVPAASELPAYQKPCLSLLTRAPEYLNCTQRRRATRARAAQSLRTLP